MTCIVGIVRDETVYLGADSAGVAGSHYNARKDEKIFAKGEFIMGFTTSFRMGQLLQYDLKLPKHHRDTDEFTYMVTDFIPALRTCLRDGGFTEKHHEAEQGGTFLVGYKGRLFEVDSDFQVGESMHDFAACGSGASVALGSLYSTQALEPHERISLALSASATFNTNVGGPFRMITSGSTKSEKVKACLAIW